MAENSQIEWTDHTFNPWSGCTKISPACDHCYAEGWAKRSGHVEWGPHGARRRTKTWGNPIKWNKALEGTGRRERVFCASLADVFDNHRSIDPKWRADLWELIRETPNLDWLLLTKRPQNIAKMVPPLWMNGHWPVGVWIGTTVENQEEADRRIEYLMEIPAKVRFLSCEPLLGPVDLRLDRRGVPHNQWHLPLGPCGYYCSEEHGHVDHNARLHWVITGGESGGQARPTNPQWFRDLRDQCACAGTPFFFKQWGEWVSVSEVEGPGDHYSFPDGRTVRRVGKKRAGRTLDGVVHDGYPTPSNREGL